MDTSAKSDVDGASVERATRRMRTLEEKLAIVEQATRPGASVAAVAREHGVNANLVFGWLRLHRRGLLQSQRHGKAAPLLPVTITTPTLTPTEPTSAVRSVKRRAGGSVPPASVTNAMMEIVLPDGVRVCLHGDAQHPLLERVLEWLPRR